jgi:hypothetical protein
VAFINLGTQVCLKLLALAANDTLVAPPGFVLQQVVIENTTVNAVTGGIRIGTTNGGTDVVVALAVGANALTFITDAALLKRLFSTSADQTLYVQAVVAWNSAALNVWLIGRVLP